MNTTAIHNYLIESYNKLAFTHNYIFGFASQGMVYGAKVENGSSLLPYITCLDRASSKNGGTYSLKYKPNRSQADLIIAHSSEVKAICSVELLEKLYTESKHNRGQIFENLAATAFGGVQVEKKNAKFTDSGDIIIDGIHYQAKYNKATFTDEKTLHNLGA